MLDRGGHFQDSTVSRSFLDYLVLGVFTPIWSVNCSGILVSGVIAQKKAKKMLTADHPAKELGGWLKAKRQARKIVARVFAMAIGISPAEYAEVELGIVKWINDKQETLIAKVLELSTTDKSKFAAMLHKARAAAALRFETLFKRAQLEPVRLCSPDGKQLTKETKEAILDAVFAPL
jgi:transcriptional regulator with XRE-family HTH domain